MELEDVKDEGGGKLVEQGRKDKSEAVCLFVPLWDHWVSFRSPSFTREHSGVHWTH